MLREFFIYLGGGSETLRCEMCGAEFRVPGTGQEDVEYRQQSTE